MAIPLPIQPPPSEVDIVGNVARSIRGAFQHDRLILRNEFSLHEELARRLLARGISFDREVRMGRKKRPDFIVDGVAVEVKVDGGEMAILRQLKRYADDPALRGVVLLVTKQMALPVTLSGKPLCVVSLWRNLL